MCCRTQKYTCVEAGALAYAILTCILSIFASIAGGGLFIYKFVHSINYQDTLVYFHIGVAAAAFVLCWITFGFSVSLAVGITQRLPSQVKLAFIFGVVEVTILVVGLAIYIGFYPEDALANGIIMAILVVYSLPLAVVWRAYKEYVEPSSKYELCARTSDP